VHTILSVIVVAILAFAGTMFDNFFAFSAQLIVTEEKRVRRVSYAQALGVATLLVLAGALVRCSRRFRCRGSAYCAWRRGPWPGTRGEIVRRNRLPSTVGAR